MSVEVQDLKAQVAKVSEMRKLEATAAETKREVAAILEQEEAKMLDMLKQSGLPNFKCEFGLVSITHRLSVKTPKTEEDRKAFFDYLRAEGLYDKMITVNSQTLNSFYKEQFKLAQDAGRDDFKMPGINEETMSEILSFRNGE